MEGRQNELLTIMGNSDAHAAKCTKLGLNFAETYPEDYAVYTDARAEYNENEHRLATLYEQRYLEEQERNPETEAE